MAYVKIYIRSTDVNRTIISAMSNILGMYGQNTGASVPGEDYPDEAGWPPGYVPVAIHTVDDDTDYIANPDADCPRQDQLWEMAKQSPELQTFQNRSDVSFETN
ncbi:unnamed protein product [Strongylus vulgaris]|uniref:Uncharacterized protein n=1 Tax=Strongylus vulgaris TaxID=40348 RepID=A0A3P7JGP4_STRVU|nr:unnamed protein product [Strongylus vulgaris]